MAFQKVFYRMWFLHSRSYASSNSRVDWKEIRPMVLERIKNRAKDYPIKSMVPVAFDVLEARKHLIHGVSILIKEFPVKSCKFCPEVYIGEAGHQIRTCHGFKRMTKNLEHRWTEGKLNDILVPVEAYHLKSMFQDIIEHDERFDYDRIPAVVELCSQAGADCSDENLLSEAQGTVAGGEISCVPLASDDLVCVAQKTLDAWERVRLGVRKLLLLYPAKVCRHCSEVHIGPSGNRARLCGIFKYESWRSYHFWKKAEVDDLVPLKMVWHRRPQDPKILLDSGRGFYGHAPAVVELCAQAGALVPNKYFCVMKLNGLTTTSITNT